jgi:hypothetical protein
MNNPIPRSGLFVTPTSFEELMEMTEGCSGSDQERRLVFLGAMMALNLAHKLIEDEAKVEA